MSELNYDNLLKLVQAGNVDEVDSLLNVSNEEILKSLGMDDKYDALIDAAIFSRNAQMVKVLFKHTNLINKTPDLMKDRLLDADGKEYANDPKVVASESDRENLHQIMDYVNQWEKAEKRANLQSYKGKHTEWQAALKKAQENGFDDLADRIQRRVDFEEQRRLEQEGKRPAGKSVDRWRDEKSWILDGQGRLEYDMYGQENREEIIQVLKQQGIAAQPMEDKQKTGGFSNYRIIVHVEDVAKLKEFLQDHEDLMAIVSKDNNQVEQTEELSPVTTDFTPDIPEGGPLFTQKDLEEYRRQQKQAQLGVNNSEYPVQKAKTEEQVIIPEVLPPEQPFSAMSEKKIKDKEDVVDVDVVMKEEQPKPTPTKEPQQKAKPKAEPQPAKGSQPTEKLADLTWQRSPLIEDKRGEHNWHFNDKGQIFYNMAGLTAEAREQVQQILASHGVECAENPEEKDALYLAHPQDFKALKRAWGRARQYQEYNQDLLLEPKPKLVEWNSPGFEKYWCQHHTKNMWLDNHPDVSSFNLKPKPYYFNVDGFDASVVKATEQYLKNMNIPFEYTEASEDLKTKDPKDNSIAKGQRVIVVKDKASIQKLHELWNATKRAPELANPPKGMLPNGMSSKANDVAQPGKGKTGKETPQQPKVPKSTSGLGAAVAKGVGKQLKNVGGTFADTLANFAKNTLAKNFNSPEEFGQEFLYQLMAFPLDWLKAYLDTIAKDEKKGPVKNLVSQNNNDDLLKKIGDIQKQAGLSDPNGTGNYTSEQHAKRVQALRDYFNAPENAAQREQLKQIAQMVGKNPEAFKPLFDKMFPNAPFGFEEAMQAIGNGNPAQGRVFSAVQPTPSKQTQVSPEMKALMQRMAQLEKRQAETEAKLAQTQKELAATKAELANSKKQLAAKDAEIAALKEKLAAYEQGKQPPVQQPETKDVKTAQVVSQEPEKVATVHTPKVETPQAAPKAPEQPAAVNTPKVKIPQLTLQEPEKPAAVNAPKVETPKVTVSPAPSAQKSQEKAPEKTVIRDLNTLEAQSQTGEVVARLEEAKTNTNDAETRAIMDVVQQWYQTPVEKRQGDLNDLIRTSKDVEAAKVINNAIDDGYDENTGLHKKVIELKDTVDKEKVLTNRERLIDKAYADLSERRPDLFEQMKLSHNKKGEAVLSIGELKVQRNQENKFAPDPADELKFSAAKSRSKAKLEEVFKRYNLSQTDKRDLRIILTYFDEQTKAQNNSKKQVVSKIKNKTSGR